MDRDESALNQLHQNWLNPDYEYDRYSSTTLREPIAECVCGETFYRGDGYLSMSGTRCCGDEDCAWDIFIDTFEFDINVDRISDKHCLCGEMIDEEKKPIVVREIKYCTYDCFWNYLKQEYTIKEVTY